MHQTPAVPTGPPIERVFRKGQRDRYSVVIDSEGTIGKTHCEYELKLSALRPIADTPDTLVGAAFLDLREKIEDTRLPYRKQFGSATYRFSKTGFPQDFSFGGSDVTLLAPVLSWYLPPIAGVGEAASPIAETVVDKIRIGGAANYKKVSATTGTVKLALFFTFEGKPAGDDDASFESTSTFETKTGTLLDAQGTMKGQGGSMTFHVKRL